jgi:hypothetical protein
MHDRPETAEQPASPVFGGYLLTFFFERDRLQQWRREIFPDLTDPEKGVGGPRNMICPSNSAYNLWARGYFALRPDLKALTVQFYWQPRPSHHRFDSVDLLKYPLSSQNLNNIGGDYLVNEEAMFIKSGDTFTLTTTDPITHPLPRLKLSIVRDAMASQQSCFNVWCCGNL